MTLFISHGRADADAVAVLERSLLAFGRDVWRDREMVGGEAWWAAILAQVRECAVFVFAISQSSLASESCSLELAYARALQIPVLLVEIGEVPAEQRRNHAVYGESLVDYRNPNADSAILLMTAVAEREAARGPLPDPLPPEPPTPYNYLLRIAAIVRGGAPIPYADQRDLIAQLRGALNRERDESVRESMRGLLAEFQVRPDTSRSVEIEVDELLRDHFRAVGSTPGAGDAWPSARESFRDDYPSAAPHPPPMVAEARPASPAEVESVPPPKTRGSVARRIERVIRGINPFSRSPRSGNGVSGDMTVNASQTSMPYQAYPYLKPTSQLPGQEFLLEPDVAFTLDVGLSGSAPVKSMLAVTPAGIGELRAGLVVHVQLSYDPASLHVQGPMPIILELTAANPYPKQAVKVTPLHTPKPLTNRRIAAHYLVDGKVRAIAFLTLREIDAACTSKLAPPNLVDLTPLADEEPPDVVLAIYGADAASPGTYTIAAFPRDLDIAPPENGRIELGPQAASFMELMFKEGSRGGDPGGVYDTLTGIGWRIGNKIPAQILRTLKLIAEDPRRERPPTMLLLTEESAVPWELATLGRGREMTSRAGGRSPFLGAHFAIGRWPIAASISSAPVPDPQRIDVRKTALVRADYDGVGEGWHPLPGALLEITDLAESYAPAIEWSPLIDEVKDNLFSDVDVIHFALHGRVDATPTESGLVLLRKDGDNVRPAYLSADGVLGLLTRDPPPFPNRPFVFLNACQVGQGDEILGDYAGLAAALIEAGARAVVACIWNVNDGVAGSIAREFYRRADTGETPAEILRAIRTRYVRPAPGDATPFEPSSASVPTLIAYQYYGHPGLQVVRAL